MIQQLLGELISSHENNRWAMMLWNGRNALTQIPQPLSEPFSIQ
jgi:hypothetical protein